MTAHMATAIPEMTLRIPAPGLRGKVPRPDPGLDSECRFTPIGRQFDDQPATTDPERGSAKVAS